MTDRLDLDRIRDAFEGRLSAEERAALEARRGAEPELDAMARDFDDVAAVGEDPVAPCTVPFERLALDDMPARRPALARWAPFLAAAAAVLVVLGGLVVSRGGSVAEAGPVVLNAVVLDERKPLEPLPVAALDYTPAGPKGLRFVDGLSDGQILAAATKRPLVVFVQYADCPICTELRSTTFHDASLAPAVERFVLAMERVDGAGGPLLEKAHLSFPAFVVFAPDGRPSGGFGAIEALRSEKGAAWITSSLGRASTRLEGGPGVPWEVVHAVARALADAEAAADLPTRVRDLSEADAAARGTALSERVHAALSALSEDARRALGKARELADAGQPAEAAKTLEEAAARYRGTPHENDLRHVRNRLVTDGRFPALEASR